MTVRPFWMALVAFALLGAAWAIALPVNGTYDESHHIARAYAVFSRQWLPRDGESLHVPASLLPTNADCTWFPRPPKPASCQQVVDSGAMVNGPSYAARYPPTYYLLVGAPIRVLPDTSGILLARLLSVLINALLLAAAFSVAARRGNRLLMAGVALVATPTLVNLTGAVNPNGVEISAAVCLFVTLLALLPPQVPDAERATPRPLLAIAGGAAFLLLTVRHSGPVMLAVDLVAIGALAGARRARQMVRSPEARSYLLPLVATGVVLWVGWVLLARSPVAGVPPGPLPDRSPGQFVNVLLTFRIPFYVKQLIGQFGYGETTMSPIAIALWYGLLAVVVIPAVTRGGGRLTAVLAGLVVASFLFLVALEIAFLHAHRWYAHGRYAMPMLVGVALIAAWAQPHRATRSLCTALVAATVPVHVYALARVMTRYQVAIDAPLNPLGGSWRPAWGSVLPLTCVVLGPVVLAAAVWMSRVGVPRRLSEPLTTPPVATPPGP